MLLPHSSLREYADLGLIWHQFFDTEGTLHRKPVILSNRRTRNCQLKIIRVNGLREGRKDC